MITRRPLLKRVSLNGIGLSAGCASVVAPSSPQDRMPTNTRADMTTSRRSVRGPADTSPHQTRGRILSFDCGLRWRGGYRCRRRRLPGFSIVPATEVFLQPDIRHDEKVAAPHLRQ